MNIFWKILLAVAFCWLLNNIFIRPLIKLRYYKKKGAYTFFFPLLGLLPLNLGNIKKNGDFYYFTKQIVKMKPDLKLVATNLGPNAILNFVDPAACKEILQNYHRYKKAPIFDIVSIPLGKSLVNLEGEEWKIRRRVFAKVFHFDYLKNLIPSIQNATNEALAEWKVLGKERPIDSLERLQCLIGGIFSTSFFGADAKNHRIDGKPVELYFAQMISNYFTATLSPLALIFGVKPVKYQLTSFYRKIASQNASFRKYANALIQERRKAFEMNRKHGNSLPSQRNLLDVLFEFKDSENGLSNEQLIDEFAGFFNGGMDTSSHLLQTAFYYLDKNPEYKQILRDEAKRVIEDPSQMLTLDQINQLEFTTAVLKETIRLVPTLPTLINRKAIVDHYIGDFFVPKGTGVVADFIALCFHPKLFKNPEVFNPYRWIKGQPDFNEEANKDPFIFTPFSAGPRNCIGQSLAMLEMKIILALFVCQFDWKVREGYKMKMILRFGYEPEEHVPIILQPLH